MRRRSPVPGGANAGRRALAIATVLAACTSGDRNEVPDPNRMNFPNAVGDEVSHPASSLVTAAPVSLSPTDGATFSHYPRHMVLTWAEVPGARSYLVEIQYCKPIGCSDTTAVRLGRATALGNAYAFDFVGSQPGRWRVQALDSTGAAGPPSTWSRFIHQR